MLTNSKNSNRRVKFISYTGEYPNLCSGVLTLEIDGVQYKFGHSYENCHYDEDTKSWINDDEDPNNPNYDDFWRSGGSVTANNDWDFTTETGEWIIDVDALDPKFWDVADEINDVFNENVPYGCCGGCI